MFLDKYLTQYDDSLHGESYIDPLGMLVIWSSYGQEIFRNRVSSISNDVRNYTLNLFHHYLVRRLIRDDTVRLGKKLSETYGGSKESLAFKHACLLHLENLFVYAILKHEGPGVESGGVLGISVARRRWQESAGNPLLTFSHKKEGQLLVRQIGLGVSGRYKTPLLEIGYFDRHYHYHRPAAASLWQQAEDFIQENDALRRLADMLMAHLRGLLAQDASPPQCHFHAVTDELTSAFAAAFASPGVVGRYARDHWLAATGLDTGAAGALLAVLDENARRAQPENFTPQRLMEMAVKHARQAALPPEETRKMAHIEQLEPFLADATLLFTLLTDTKAQKLDVIAARWQAFKRDAQTLPRHALALRANPPLLAVAKGSARIRLSALLRLADATTLAAQAALLIDYHHRVMAERGQQPWLTLTDDAIRVHVRPLRKPAEQDWPPGAWYNTYYLPQFKGLVRGYQGAGA